MLKVSKKAVNSKERFCASLARACQMLRPPRKSDPWRRGPGDFIVMLTNAALTKSVVDFINTGTL
jgi:hypothetical protein